MEPRIQYAKTSDGVNIAYAVFGDGPAVVYAAGIASNLHIFTHPFSSRPMLMDDALIASGWRVIRYDLRGTGSSDRGNLDFSLEARLRDLDAVVERLGAEPFVLAGSGITAVAYATRSPERVSHLLLVATYASEADFRKAVPAIRAARAMETMAEEDWEYFSLALASATTGFEDAARARELAAAMRAGMSASAYVAYMQASENIDVKDLLHLVTAPTLVVHNRTYALSNADLLRVLASGIPGARFVTTDDPPRAVVQFLRDTGGPGHGSVSAPAPADVRGLVTILFTDIEGSTPLTQRLGDARARDVLREHERTTRECLKAHGGSEVKTMGDGFMASFGSATRALECAIAIQRAFEERNTSVGATGRSPLRVRIGLNAGEPIAEEDPGGRSDLFGTAVITTARIAAQAQGGEILVSNVVRELVAGKEFLFADRGETALRGFEDPVRLFEMRWRESEQ